ncbi:hypothetical protein LCGC14_1000230 [marine sediment metagenome]|uniref:Uncharacterized protein n=1 Tax=marine sediment metagenome TaxID=412755 RepID=A0A0F9NPR8_9ZZZZ
MNRTNVDTDSKNQQRCEQCQRVVGTDCKGKKLKCSCAATYKSANKSLRRRDRHGIIK